MTVIAEEILVLILTVFTIGRVVIVVTVDGEVSAGSKVKEGNVS